MIGKLIERQAHIAKAIGQTFKDVVQFAPARRGVRGKELIIRATDLFVKFHIRRAPATPMLCVLVKNPADEERIVADMSAQKKRLLRRDPGQGNEHVRNVLRARLVRHVRRAQKICARKCLQKRTDVIAQFSIANSSLLQNVTGEHVKIKLRGNGEMIGVGQDRIDQARMVEHVIARIGVREQIDKRNVIFLRTRQRAHDKVKIRCGKPRPAIRPDHRELSMSDLDAKMQASSCLVYEESELRFGAINDFVRSKNRCPLFLRLGEDSQADCKP